MTQPAFFIICSLSRCGSTAIHRALNCHSEITCLYEPPFHLAAWTAERVHDRAEELRRQCSGIKHVWDPAGFPFRTDQIPRVAAMNRDAEQWVRLNAALVSRPNQRVVFLRRRNRLQRAVSDLLGQQTQVWGPHHASGASPDAAAAYRSRVRDRPIESIDLETLDWYMARIPDMEGRIREAVGTGDCIDLYYEDIFGPEVRADARMAMYHRVVEFLGYATAESNFDSSDVETLLGPSGKLNTQAIYRRIPNIRAIEDRWGVVAGGA